SQCTHKSTKVMWNIIEQLQAEARQDVQSMEIARSTASQGMERVWEAALALLSMIQHVERMNQMNAETLKNMQMQVEFSHNVSAGVESISGHSYQSADTAAHTAEISRQLVDMANHLSTLVSRFRL